MKMKGVRENIDRAKEGYTLDEMRILTDQMIDEMAERLRKRLRSTRTKRKYDMIVPMSRKKTQKKQEGYSPEELDIHMRAYIKASAERLRKELRKAWKKNASQRRRVPYGVTV